MVKRLTKRITSNIIELSSKANPFQFVNSPQRVHSKHPFWNVFNRLCEYEDLDEQGLLLRLPSEIHDIDKKALEYSIIKAINLTKYGVDVSDKFETATGMNYALNQAYLRGRQDEIDRINRLRKEEKLKEF